MEYSGVGPRLLNLYTLFTTKFNNKTK